MTNKDKKILNFILDEHPDEVLRYVAKNPVADCIQKELLDNYPETFNLLAPSMIITEDVMIKMITSKRKSLLPIIMKKHLSFKEQIMFIRTYPEKVKEYQDFLNKAEDENDCLCPSAENEYFKIKQQRPELPEIQYIWHPEYAKKDENIELLDIDVI